MPNASPRQILSRQRQSEPAQNRRREMSCQQNSVSSILGVKRLIFTVVFWATSLNASALWCTGQVPQSLVYATGALTITSEWRANWTQLCNVNVEWKGIPTETCKSWLAIIESAKARNASVTVNYAAGTGDCATLPVYGSAPAPVYVLSDAN